MFVFDADTLAPRGHYDYPGQGWGLTYDGEHLIMSDGSATLRVIDPTDFSVVRRITVRQDGAPVDNLVEFRKLYDRRDELITDPVNAMLSDATTFPQRRGVCRLDRMDGDSGHPFP